MTALNNEACSLIKQGYNDDAIGKLNRALLDLTHVKNSITYHKAKAEACSILENTGRNDSKNNKNSSRHTQPTTSYYPENAYDEGMTTFSQPLSICEESNRNGHDEHIATIKAVIFFNLAIAFARKGEEFLTQVYLQKSFRTQQSRTHHNSNQQQSIYGPSLCAILHNIGHSYWRCRRYADAAVSYEGALDLLCGPHSTEQHNCLDISATLNCIAVVLYYGNLETEKSLEILTRALSMRCSVSSVLNREAATIMNNVGRIRFSRGEFAAALAVYKKAYTGRLAVLGSTHIDVAASLFNMAQTEEQLGHIPEAIRLYKQSLSVFMLHMGEGDKQVADVLLKIGTLSNRNKDLGQAYDFLLRALTASKLAYGPTSHKVASTMSRIGNVLYNQNKLDLSLEFYRLGLVVERILYSRTSDHSSLEVNTIAATLTNIARIYQFQDKYDIALDTYTEAIHIMRHNNNHRATADILMEIGYTYEMKDNFDYAAIAIAEAVGIFRGLQGVAPTDGNDDDDILLLLASSLNHLGLIQSKQESMNLALVSFLEATSILRSLGTTRSIRHFTAIVCLNAAEECEKVDETDRALELYEEALLLEQMKSRDEGSCPEDGSTTATSRDLADTSPNQKRTAFLCCRIGTLRRKRGDLDGALHYLNLSSKICSLNPTVIDDEYAYGVLQSLADLHIQMGDRSKARMAYGEAVFVYQRKTNPPAAAAA